MRNLLKECKDFSSMTKNCVEYLSNEGNIDTLLKWLDECMEENAKSGNTWVAALKEQLLEAVAVGMKENNLVEVLKSIQFKAPEEMSNKGPMDVYKENGMLDSLQKILNSK